MAMTKRVQDLTNPVAPAEPGAARGMGAFVPPAPIEGTGLQALCEELGGAALTGAPSVPGAASLVLGVQQDSRRVRPGDLFVALRGEHADGAAFVATAVAHGAVAVMREQGFPLGAVGVPCLEVVEPRRALARAAALVYGRPTEAMQVVGITGTNGKTTTTHLARHAIEAAGHAVGTIGTLGYRLAGELHAATHTSPEADELQRVAAAMRARGATHLVMEVSSIAIAAARVADVRFQVAAFTNLTQDHLDYHGTMAAYAAAKDRLFFEWEPPVAVVNVDDPHGASLAARLRQERPAIELLRISADPLAAAEVRPREQALDARGIRLRLRTPVGDAELCAPLVGAHNVANLLCTVGILLGLRCPLEPALAALASLPPVPGRLERCDEPGRDDLVVLVDYAHTPDALERVLASVRAWTTGRLWCVFGCGGDRDRGKRGPMGEAVGRAADRAIVTNDNPRSEDPRVIADAVMAGVRAAGANVEVDLDRAHAIERAILAAEPGDVVLVAGKGHETTQTIGHAVSAFDDRDEVRRALELRRARAGRGGA
jgi:UDP-N-acetylmuramoyl-L-alanyl-D-glutamate--2,6-diaminopimelate ligase